MTNEERLIRLEVLMTDMSEDYKSMAADVKELTVLKNKGLGAFWLVAGILSGSFLAGIAMIIQLIRGH